MAMEDLLPRASRINPNVGLLCWFVELCVVIKQASDVFAGNFDAFTGKDVWKLVLSCRFSRILLAFHTFCKYNK
jgi:hypothetical protein